MCALWGWGRVDSSLMLARHGGGSVPTAGNIGGGGPNPPVGPAATAAATSREAGLGRRSPRVRPEWDGAWGGVDEEGSDAR